jgi:hypothetical protein
LKFFVKELAKFYLFFIPIDLDYFVISACDFYALFCCDYGLFLFAFDLVIPFYCFLFLFFIDNLALVSDLLLKIVRIGEIDWKRIHLWHNILLKCF